MQHHRLQRAVLACVSALSPTAQAQPEGEVETLGAVKL